MIKKEGNGQGKGNRIEVKREKEESKIIKEEENG